MAGKKQAVLPPEETALFCEQVAMALGAGIPLFDAMETLKDTYETSRYGETFVAMFETVKRTGSLQKAMAGAGIFPAYAVGMTAVGEQTGKLDGVLTALGNYYRWEADVRISVHNAVVYPVVLVVMLSVVVLLLITSVLPVFERVFENLGVSTGAAGTGVMSASFIIGEVALATIGVVLLVGLVIAVPFFTGSPAAPTPSRSGFSERGNSFSTVEARHGGNLGNGDSGFLKKMRCAGNAAVLYFV